MRYLVGIVFCMALVVAEVKNYQYAEEQAAQLQEQRSAIEGLQTRLSVLENPPSKAPDENADNNDDFVQGGPGVQWVTPLTPPSDGLGYDSHLSPPVSPAPTYTAPPKELDPDQDPDPKCWTHGDGDNGRYIVTCIEQGLTT